jgi:hypothetical protein
MIFRAFVPPEDTGRLCGVQPRSTTRSTVKNGRMNGGNLWLLNRDVQSYLERSHRKVGKTRLFACPCLSGHLSTRKKKENHWTDFREIE